MRRRATISSDHETEWQQAWYGHATVAAEVVLTGERSPYELVIAPPWAMRIEFPPNTDCPTLYFCWKEDPL